MGYSALAFIIQHLSTGTEKKVGKAGAVASWFLQVSLCFMFHFLRSVVSKTFWNGFELLNYLSIRHLDPFEAHFVLESLDVIVEAS